MGVYTNKNGVATRVATNNVLRNMNTEQYVTEGELVEASNSGSYNKRMIELNFAHSSIVVGHKYRVCVGDNVFDIGADI